MLSPSPLLAPPLLTPQVTKCPHEWVLKHSTTRSVPNTNVRSLRGCLLKQVCVFSLRTPQRVFSFIWGYATMMMPTTEDTRPPSPMMPGLDLQIPNWSKGFRISQKFFTVSRSKGGWFFRDRNKRRRKDWSHSVSSSATLYPRGSWDGDFSLFALSCATCSICKVTS